MLIFYRNFFTFYPYDAVQYHCTLQHFSYFFKTILYSNKCDSSFAKINCKKMCGNCKVVEINSKPMMPAKVPKTSVKAPEIKTIKEEQPIKKLNFDNSLPVDTNCNGIPFKGNFHYNMIYVTEQINKKDLCSDFIKIANQGFNLIVLSFLQSNIPISGLITWLSLSYDAQKSCVENLEKLGARLLLSATDTIDATTVDKGKYEEIALTASQIVRANHFHGVCLDLVVIPTDWEDDKNVENLKEIFKTVTLATRKYLPVENFIVAHSSVGPSLQHKVGYRDWLIQYQDLINFVSIHYFNSGPNYNTYQKIFIENDIFKGTTVKSLIKDGLNPQKILIGKPVNMDIAKGYINPIVLNRWSCRFRYDEKSRIGGFMTWLYNTENENTSETWAQAITKKCLTFNEDICNPETEEKFVSKADFTPPVFEPPKLAGKKFQGQKKYGKKISGKKSSKKAIKSS